MNLKETLADVESLFKKKPMVFVNAPDQPNTQAPVVPDEAGAEKKEAPKAAAQPVAEPQEPADVEREVTEDRSAFNCPDCKGEGLKDQYTLCPNCHGTGKV